MDLDARLSVTSCKIDLDFGDGLYTFALPLAQIAELQRKTGVGIGALHARMLRGCEGRGGQVILNPAHAEFYASDIVETIRHGLIGGGVGLVNGAEVQVTPLVAKRLIETYVETSPLAVHFNVALSTLIACVVGYDPPKKEEPAAKRATTKSKAGSTTGKRSRTAQ